MTFSHGKNGYNPRLIKKLEWKEPVWHSPFKLYLYPDNPKLEIDYKLLETTLEKQQFIGTEISKGRYGTGANFLSLLTFMGCSPDIEIAKLNWRKSAFIAKCWVEVGNIYELEAIPSDSLLAVLGNETGLKWKAAYIREGAV